MVEDDIAALIATDGNGTVGGNVFIGPLPASPDLAVSVSPTVGPPPEYVYGEVDIAIEKPRVQVRVRGEERDYDAPRTLMEQIYRGLSRRGAFTVNSTRYLDLTPLQAPFVLGQDDTGRWIFAVNFEAWKEVVAL